MPLYPIILPQCLDTAASGGEPLPFLRLPHPRTRLPVLFLPHSAPGPSSSPYFASPEAEGKSQCISGADKLGGILELQCVAGPKDAERSWFVQREAEDTVVSDGRLMLLTPIDPFFLLLSLLVSLAPVDLFALSSGESQTPASGRYEPLEDLLDRATTRWPSTEAPCDSKDVDAFTELPAVRACVPRLCEKLEQGSGEPLWRLSKDKVTEEVMRKVDRIVASFGDKGTLAGLVGKEGVFDAPTTDPALLKEARHKVAIELIGGYLPEPVSTALFASHPFPLLAAHRAMQSTLSDSVLSTSYMPGLSSSASAGEKPNSETKDNAKLTKKGSRGVEALKKVSTRGMQKLGDMFKAANEKKRKAAELQAGQGTAEDQPKPTAETGATESRRSPRKKTKT